MNEKNKSKIITICSLSLTFIIICILIVVLIQPKNKNDDTSSLFSTSTLLTSSSISEKDSVASFYTSTSSTQQNNNSSRLLELHNTSSTKSQPVVSEKPVLVSSEISQPESSSSEAVILPIISTPSSSNNNELEKIEFIQMYTQTENKYIQQLSNTIDSYNQEIASWEAKSSECYSNKLAEDQRINIRFEAMGMLNSGAHKGALKSNEDNYLATVKEYQDNISNLTERKETIEKELENINPYTILGMFPEEHGLTVSEAVEKYLKYIAQ